MANEVQFRGPGTSRTCYIVIRNRTNQPWSTSGGTGAFANFVSGAWPEYVIAASEQGVTNNYAASMPAAVPPGVYNITAYQQVDVTADQLDPGVAAGQEQWNGTALAPLSDTATSGQLGQYQPMRLARGVQITNFPVYLKSSVDHITPLTSGVISGQISRDGGAFGALQSGAFTEIGLGFYNLQALTSGDLVANAVSLLFTAVGISGGSADPLPMSFILQRVSGQTVT